MKKDASNSGNRAGRLFWTLQFSGWGGATLLAIAFSSVGYFPWRVALILGLFRTGFGFAATCGLRYAWQRLWRWPGNFWLKGMTVFLVCGLVGLADGLATGVGAEALGLDLGNPAFRLFFVASPFMRWMLFWLWSLLYFGIRYWLDTEETQLRLARAEAAARTSELQLLRAQVNPHFLFNALNSILAESRNPPMVRSLTLALAAYLRFSLRQRDETNRLGVELEALEHYLEVEKARFEENLHYCIEAPAEARQAVVPTALVQPLLENAIKYGQRSGVRPLRITISAGDADGILTVAVVNSGRWFVPGEPSSTGTGLANLRRRLHLLYGEAASLSTACEKDRVHAVVRLPLKDEGRAR